MERERRWYYAERLEEEEGEIGGRGVHGWRHVLTGTAPRVEKMDDAAVTERTRAHDTCRQGAYLEFLSATCE